MAGRIDFHDDPDAPAASSIVPAVNVAVTNDAGELLLIRRSDNDNWALPGGGVDIGESLTQAALLPRHVILYTSNGEVRQEFSIVLTAIATGGQLAVSSETTEARWVKPGDVARYQMDRSMRQRVAHVLEGRDRPYVG